MDSKFYGIIVAAFLWFICAFIKKHGKHLDKLKKLPPGPRRWPVVGNLFQLDRSPHESFARLAKVHGPIMTLWLGSMKTVVISSHHAAREMFKNHDAALAGRKIYESMKGDFGNEGSIITAQHGPHWRMLRRLCTAEFFVASKLDASRCVRAKCVDRMVEFIDEDGARKGLPIDVGRYFFLMAFNLIGNLLFSKDLLDPSSKRGARFFHHAGRVMEMAGKPNVADFLPFLRWLDPQGIRRETQFHVERAFEIAGEYIKERMVEREKRGIEECKDKKEKKRKDYLDVLLEFRGSGNVGEPLVFSSRTINVIVFEMFTAGTDTTTSTLEWAMAELLHNPRTLEKLQSELRSTIGKNKKLEETDLENLPYLKATVKETLRLHPPLPFLVPHMAMESRDMLGFCIPKETQVLVNVRAIGRDPDTWRDPNEFRPERFLDLSLDFKGQNFEFMPFGSGRRICPAIPLVTRVLPAALGSVLLSFDWSLAEGLRGEDLDMGESMGITLRKAVPLSVTPIVVQEYFCRRRE